MTGTRVYQSSNGDAWDIVHGRNNEMHIRHTPNAASGGQTQDIALEDFLQLAADSPEHQAVVAHLGLSIEGGASGIRGYVHDPKEPDGPYIAVVLSDNQGPVVTLHKSYADAERELHSRLAILRLKTLSHELRHLPER